jgi:excisionase family DNA binding protein
VSEFYTVEEIAEMLRVTDRTIRAYINNGDLKAVKLGKYWRIPKEAFNEFIEKHSN